MKLPDGSGVKSRKNAKLERANYGLKQSGREWGHLCADTLLIIEGFEQCKADQCIFRNIVDVVIVLIVGVGGPEVECLNKKFRTNNLGASCTCYDGCGVERNLELGTLRVSQQAYVETIMKRFIEESNVGYSFIT